MQYIFSCIFGMKMKKEKRTTKVVRFQKGCTKSPYSRLSPFLSFLSLIISH